MPGRQIYASNYQLTTGFELEFVSPHNHYDIAYAVCHGAGVKAANRSAEYSTYAPHPQFDWSAQHDIGTDNSINPAQDRGIVGFAGFGLEWRSRTWKVKVGTKPEIPDEMFKIMGVLESFGCRTNQRCGIHIHLSQQQDFSFRDLAFFEARVEKLRNAMFQPRKSYAIPTRCSDTAHHYNAISLKNDRHLEVRIFNSTLNKRALRAYYNMLLS